MIDRELDQQQLDAWRAGDERAGKRLIERHLNAVARFFRNKVGAAFEDLVQQTFLAFVEGRDRIRDGGAVRSYLFATARYVLQKHVCQLARGRVDLGVTSIAELALGPSSIVAQREEHRILLAALRRLPVDHQIALELSYWEGLNSAQIAAIFEISHSAMRSRMIRARELLGEQIQVLTASSESLEQTLTKFEDWAAELRGRMAEPPS